MSVTAAELDHGLEPRAQSFARNRSQALTADAHARARVGLLLSSSITRRPSAHLEPDVGRRTLGPDPHRTPEDHAQYVCKLSDARNPRQHSPDQVDLIGG
jgi:hypothetical protein